MHRKLRQESPKHVEKYNAIVSAFENYEAKVAAKQAPIKAALETTDLSEDEISGMLKQAP